MCLYIVGFSKEKKAALRAPGNGCSDEQATNGSPPAGDMRGRSAEEEGGEDGVPPPMLFTLRQGPLGFRICWGQGWLLLS